MHLEFSKLKLIAMYKKGFVQKFSFSLVIRKTLYIVGSIILFSTLLTGKADAQGNLLITPRRVVFDGSKRTQELNLANTGADTSRYNVSIIDYRMKEDGTFEQISKPDSGQYFADNYIRFFPRSVTLAPNEAQVVKMQLVRTKDLAPGEYRSHVYFRAVPNIKPLGEEEAQADQNSIAVKLTPVFGITIPVIIRIGESTAKVKLSDFSLEMLGDTLPKLNMQFNRSGNMSVYGDVSVIYISPNGESIPVGLVRGIAVYTPNKIRKFQFDLANDPAVNYHTGSLRITYTAQDEENPRILDEALFQLH